MSLQLTLPGGVMLTVVNWEISMGSTLVQSGSIDVDDSQIASFVVGGLGAGPYTVVLSASSADGTVTCQGQSVFTIAAAQTAPVSVALACSTAPFDAGSAVVAASSFNCATIQSIAESPTEVSVGGAIGLTALATAPAPGAISYSWSAPTGSFTAPNSATTTFTCTVAGTVSISLVAGDGPVPEGGTCDPTLSSTTATVVCGCPPPVESGSSAVTFQIDPGHTGSQPHDQITVPLCQRWSATFSNPLSTPHIPVYPVVADGRVFQVTNYSLYALDARTGVTLWGPIALPNASDGFGYTAYDGGTLFLLAQSGDLTAFEPDNGDVLWHVALQDIPIALPAFSVTTPQYFFPSPPVASGGIVYLLGGGLGATLYALDEVSGNLLWTANQNSLSFTLPAVSTGQVYVPDGCGAAAYGSLSGSLLWDAPQNCTDMQTAQLAFFGGDVYALTLEFGSESGVVLESDGGTAIGTFSATDLPAFSTPSYYYVSGGQLFAAPLGSTTPTWTFAGDQALVTSPVVVGTQVVVGSSNGNVFVVNAGDGQLLGSANAGSPILPSSVAGSLTATGLVVADGILFVSTESSLVAY